MYQPGKVRRSILWVLFNVLSMKLKGFYALRKNVLQVQHGFERQKIQMLILDSDSFFLR